MFALDLQELRAFRRTLWPLDPLVVQFREKDHLKNGEGAAITSTSAEADTTTSTYLSLADRILRLVAQKTNNKFEPTLQTHRIILLTHLCYYSYNFNPVSFYYIIDKTSNSITAMVGEVSNTPWTEQYSYVLHPDSIDKVQSTKESSQIGNVTKTKMDYSFPKTFHVSPFMEMDFWYDWSFVGIPERNLSPHLVSVKNTGSKEKWSEDMHSASITVVNMLRKRSNDQLAFTAKLIMEPCTITPFGVAWQMIRFPIFCMIIQIWIHYQAAILFLKGIVYVPHPHGSETVASKIIASIMIPFFAIRDYIDPKCKTA